MTPAGSGNFRPYAPKPPLVGETEQEAEDRRALSTESRNVANHLMGMREAVPVTFFMREHAVDARLALAHQLLTAVADDLAL